MHIAASWLLAAWRGLAPAAAPDDDRPMPPDPAGPRDTTVGSDRAMPPPSVPPPSGARGSDRAMPPGSGRRADDDDLHRSRRDDDREVGPRAQSMELALVVGTWVVPRAHELYDDNRGWSRLRPAAAQLGGRIDYFPLRHLGFELDASVMPTKTTAGARATLWSARGGLVARGPWRVTPVGTAGIGVLGVSSSPAGTGDDLDESFHIGAGVAWYAAPHLVLRLDARDNLTHRRGDGGRPTHHVDIGLSIGVVLFDRAPRSQPSRPPADGDRDKVADDYDRCPADPGPPPIGCPPAPADGDGDGFADRDDACPADFGGEPDGCPPATDLDGDGLVAPEDRCPTVRGAADDGCPHPTRAPSTEVAPEVAALEGVLGDVTFDHNTAKLQAAAHAKLSAIADVLAQQPNVRIELVGHTDDRGTDDANRTLSLQRAESVRKALVDRGIATERITTRGAGGDEPLASNATPQGRATNRRVELRVLPPP